MRNTYAMYPHDLASSIVKLNKNKHRVKAKTCRVSEVAALNRKLSHEVLVPVLVFALEVHSTRR